MRPENKLEYMTVFADDTYADVKSDYTMAMAREMQRQIEEDIMKTIMVPAIVFEPVDTAPTRKRFKTIG